ncbi:selenoprotein O and cysteine-containing homologs [Gracilibacillus boraciitolerans JCM 21714]|uniref:Protein nucleotidyltransferase YdiU n=1 Tax=Gracilibacillus boraciitolerans JCM 21714 TaxID=1298598 RepID=W4VMP9_9BACI|nr:YdiU family protein [Gracilibacillus boraciitolerans]GAE94457.1 selenoprotein O and cysteine-containing homologs [Gracilibacillus boraciitolerans JCM 21714]
MTKHNEWNLDNSYQRLPGIFYSRVSPVAVKAPILIKLNESLAKELGLDIEELKKEPDIFAGNQLPEGSVPIAQAYAGHQFANFTMLGDGRAVLLGEQITPEGRRVDIQLKGSGRTPYSRGGDGRAALGPMLREYIMSEAMHGLNIPTNRSLAVATTGESVQREIDFPGAIVTRVASSHIRVGTFQFARQWGGTVDDLRALADYTIDRHFPDIKEDDNPYLSLLKEVSKRQAALIAKWQLVGFIHGVMNTDNMAISGETIDYGPCAFMNSYDKSTVFSSIDVQGRYAYGNQPDIGGWNLARFAESILILINEDEQKALPLAKEVIEEYVQLYDQNYLNGIRKKLGIVKEKEDDTVLIRRLLDLMEQHKADFTNTFRALTLDQFDDNIRLFQSKAFKEWYQQWQDRLDEQNESKEQVQQLMRTHNPSIIPRNHRVEEAIEAAVSEADYQVMDQLLSVLSNPYAYTADQEPYTIEPPDSDDNYQTFCGT